MCPGSCTTSKGGLFTRRDENTLRGRIIHVAAVAPVSSGKFELACKADSRGVESPPPRGHLATLLSTPPTPLHMRVALCRLPGALAPFVSLRVSFASSQGAVMRAAALSHCPPPHLPPRPFTSTLCLSLSRRSRYAPASYGH